MTNANPIEMFLARFVECPYCSEDEVCLKDCLYAADKLLCEQMNAARAAMLEWRLHYD